MTPHPLTNHRSSRILCLMLFRIARLLQFAGLIILPAAIAGNVAEKLDLRQSLTWSGVGMAIFFLGWVLQRSLGSS
jgi:hypothetical protein